MPRDGANVFVGPGECRALCRSLDWSRTPLGAVETWPDALVHAVRLVMANGIPGTILWGADLAQVYNDAYARLITDRHPQALGRPNRETWPEVWHINGPIFERVLAGETVTTADAIYPLKHGDTIENMALTISYSPVLDDDGRVAGVFANMIETTDRVQLRVLQSERSSLIEQLEGERARLAGVFRDTPSFLAVLRGEQHRFELVNEAYHQLVGGRELLGRTAAEALPEAMEQGFIDILDRVLHTGEPFIGREIPIMLQRAPAAPPEQRFLDFAYMPFLEEGRATGVVAHGNDVTDAVIARREVERLLAQSTNDRLAAEADRARLEDVLEGMSDAHCTMDADFRFTRINRAFEEGLKMSRATLLGRTHWEAFPASVGSEFERQYRGVQATREETHFTAPYVGEGLDMIVEVDAYPAEGGGLSVFWRNVTERVRSDEALADSESRFRTVQDTSPNGSLLLRPVREGHEIVDFEYVYANPAAGRLTGIGPAELIGNRMLTVFPDSPRDGYFNHVKRVCETGEPFDEETVYHRDGREVGLHLTIVQARDLVHVRFADITGRMREAREREQLFDALEGAYAQAQATELRLRNLFEQAPLSIAVMEGAELRYTIVSPSYAQVPGFGRQLVGRTVHEAFPEVDPTGFPRIMRQVYDTGVPFRAQEQRVMLDHGGGNLVEHFFDIGYQPLRNAGGKVYGIASVAYDVTEQIRARQEVERARETAERALREAEAASRAKSEFLAVMSHELRTPLNAIGGYTELIELGIHGPITDAQRTALARIQASQRHLLGLINGVLNYSRVEAGAVTYDLQPIPVAEAIAEAETLIAPQLRAKGLGYTWMGCAPQLTLLADREKLQQILLNLLSNAVKFTDARGGVAGRVIVSCDIDEPPASERDARETCVRIHVRDTGVGIEAEKMRTIFEPFVQVDQRLTRRQEGVGLGLTISRDLARGMNGDLTAESTPGVGSVFTLALPMG